MSKRVPLTADAGCKWCGGTGRITARIDDPPVDARALTICPKCVRADLKHLDERIREAHRVANSARELIARVRKALAGEGE